MTYNTPELLLVGAAQNLVLQTSPVELKNDIDCKRGPNDNDRVGEAEYDSISSW